MVVEGFLRLPLPTLLPIGAVNCYILRGDSTAMIDTGPKNEYTLEFLRNELKQRDMDISSIDKILITHGHVDHFGLARQVSEASDAEILVHMGDENLVKNFKGTFVERKEQFQEEMKRCGVPARTVDLVEDFFDFLSRMADSTNISGYLEDGQEIDAGDSTLEVVHTPGHSAGSVSFLSSDGFLFSGDTLARDYTPSIICAGTETLSAGLDEYLKSLEKLKGIDAKEVHPGHGGPFSDKNEAIDECLETMRTREARIIQSLQIESATPFDLMTRVFGPLPIHEIFPGLSETLGFLDKLLDERIVEETLEDDERKFSLIS
ncbi:MAG: MBL fold metallo-hydrolase [Thermoplasmata archaeon]